MPICTVVLPLPCRRPNDPTRSGAYWSKYLLKLFDIVRQSSFRKSVTVFQDAALRGKGEFRSQSPFELPQDVVGLDQQTTWPLHGHYRFCYPMRMETVDLGQRADSPQDQGGKWYVCAPNIGHTVNLRVWGKTTLIVQGNDRPICIRRSNVKLIALSELRHHISVKLPNGSLKPKCAHPLTLCLIQRYLLCLPNDITTAIYFPSFIALKEETLRIAARSVHHYFMEG